MNRILRTPEVVEDDRAIEDDDLAAGAEQGTSPRR